MSQACSLVIEPIDKIVHLWIEYRSALSALGYPKATIMAWRDEKSFSHKVQITFWDNQRYTCALTDVLLQAVQDPEDILKWNILRNCLPKTLFYDMIETVSQLRHAGESGTTQISFEGGQPFGIPCTTDGWPPPVMAVSQSSKLLDIHSDGVISPTDPMLTYARGSYDPKNRVWHYGDPKKSEEAKAKVEAYQEKMYKALMDESFSISTDAWLKANATPSGDQVMKDIQHAKKLMYEEEVDAKKYGYHHLYSAQYKPLKFDGPTHKDGVKVKLYTEDESKYPSGGQITQTLSNMLPGMNTPVKCPAFKAGEVYCGARRASDQYDYQHGGKLTSMIPHLNDYHRWTREQIADWLESTDLDLRFPTPKEEDRHAG